MPKKTTVPDAWEDDWEAAADRAAVESEDPPAQAPPRLSKAERLAQHVEENRKLWESAESTETFHFVDSQSSGGVPLVPPYQKQVKVLSRRPPPPQVSIARKDGTGAGAGAAAAAMANLALRDDGVGDDDEPKEQMLTLEQVRERQAKEREEKRKRYNEARARIFGEPSPADSQGGDEGSSSNAQSRANSQGPSTTRGADAQSQQQKSQRGKGRPRGRLQHERGGRQTASPSPGRNAWNGGGGGGGGELYDPSSYSPRPAVPVQEAISQDDGGGGGVPLGERDQTPQQPFRQPRVPEHGAGFAAARSRNPGFRERTTAF